MRLIKVTGGLGNQMFIYAFYLRMKKYYPKVRIDLSDMMHYKVHYGYEMHRVFKLPHTEFCINQPLKKIIEFLFFKKIYERKQAPNSLRAFEKKYFWPLLYFILLPVQPFHLINKKTTFNYHLFVWQNRIYTSSCFQRGLHFID